jgi:glycogen(starch) synthase
VIDFVTQRDDFREILDIGGGMARISSALNSFRGRSVICADISLDMLKMGQSRCDQDNPLDFVQCDAHTLPFTNKSFNCIIALDLLCHLKTPVSALQEFHRVLTDNGILVIDSTNSVPLWPLFYPRYMGFNPFKWLKIIRHKGVLPGWESIVTHYTKNEFFSFLLQAQFHIDQTLVYGPKICPKWHLAIAKRVVSGKM